MISKEIFIKSMEKLTAYNDGFSKIRNIFKELFPEVGDFWMPEPFGVVISILEDIFQDTKNHWIEYFVFEEDYLRDFKIGDVRIYENPVDLSDWEKVYDFLLGNMESKEEI